MASLDLSKILGALQSTGVIGDVAAGVEASLSPDDQAKLMQIITIFHEPDPKEKVNRLLMLLLPAEQSVQVVSILKALEATDPMDRVSMIVRLLVPEIENPKHLALAVQLVQTAIKDLQDQKSPGRYDSNEILDMLKIVGKGLLG